MRFSLFFLPALALATPIVESLEKRANNAAAIESRLKTLRTDVVKENTTLNGFGNSDVPTTTQLLALNSGAQAISQDLGNLTNFCTSSTGKFTAAQSTTIYNYLNKQAYPPTNQLISNFISHYPGINKGGFRSIVHDQLVSLKGMTDDFASCLVGKAQGPNASKAPALKTKFDNAFQKGITKYAS